MGYRVYNPNPLKKQTGDCVVRALVKVSGGTWDSVYSELCQIGLRLKVMPNSDESWKSFLTKRGFKYNSIPNPKGSKRPSVAQFAAAHPKGRFVLRVANHIVACIDGVYYDTWNSGAKPLYGYWSK